MHSLDTIVQQNWNACFHRDKAREWLKDNRERAHAAQRENETIIDTAQRLMEEELC